MPAADTVVILDFETTGLSPDIGDRAIEIGAVRIDNGQITGRFQELMNPGQRISSFIESYTGITNAMLKNAHNLVAHNASFDKRFLDAELERISLGYSGQFACSMLAARRIYQQAPNHQLGTLVAYLDIAVDGVFHRALYDSEMTTKLWSSMLDNIGQQYGLSSIPFSLMQKLTKTPKKAVQGFLESSC
jgi:DNA polymerase-3 subunit epsilon